MKRIKATFDAESAARSDGIKKDAAIAAGFTCECGKHSDFSNYVIAHWADVLQHRCPQCGRVHKLHKGVVTEISGPQRRVSKVKGKPEALDPRKPLWRCYQPLNNGALGVTYQPASDYCSTLDEANDLGWTYANKVEPYNRNRREDLFRNLVRREEWPMLSTVEVAGLVVGGGDVNMLGSTIEDARGQCRHIELRTPKGTITRITFTEEVWQEIMRGFEMKPMLTKEALAVKKKEK